MRLKQLNNANSTKATKLKSNNKKVQVDFLSEKEQHSFQSLKGEQVAFKFVL